MAVVAFTVAASWSVIDSKVDTTEAREKTDATADAAVVLAAPLAHLCSTDPLRAAEIDANCPVAEQVARGDIPQPDPAPAGRGIVSTTIQAGRLVIAYSDNTTVDVGPVDGEPDADGVKGRGISSTTIVDGRLMVVYSDGSTTDLGPVVGPAGVGVASLDGSSGRLMVTLTNGLVVDAGPLPPGPPGKDAPPTPPIASVTRHYTDDESTEVCRRVAGSPDTDPRFDCERTPAAGTDGSSS